MYKRQVISLHSFEQLKWLLNTARIICRGQNAFYFVKKTTTEGD